jgi:quinol-cytochrome oxidoreductase complex cytochrome b subunit
MESPDAAAQPASRPKQVGLAALMAVVATNVWVGGPIVALWIGSWLQTRSGGSLTIRPSTALAVFASLAVITVILVKLLQVVSGAYDRAVGAGPAKRRHDSWVSVERKSYERPSLSALERILVVVVAMAVIAFEIWFSFFSTSPIDQRSGRSEIPLASAHGHSTPSLPPWLHQDQRARLLAGSKGA